MAESIKATANKTEASGEKTADNSRSAEVTTVPDTPMAQLMQLHQTYGNLAVQRWLASGALQTQPEGTPPAELRSKTDQIQLASLTGNKLEGSQIQKQVEEEEVQTKALEEDSLQKQGEDDEELQTKGLEEEENLQKQDEEEVQTQRTSGGIQFALKNRNDPFASPEVLRTIQAERGQGEPLDSGVRFQMERSMGTDFDSVRVHRDATAARLNGALAARAFTNRDDIYFNQGQYNPDSRGGRHLIAHELAHVVQQRSVPGLQFKLQDPGTRSKYENDADITANRVVNSDFLQAEKNRIDNSKTHLNDIKAVQLKSDDEKNPNNDANNSGVVSKMVSANINGISVIIDQLISILKRPEVSWILKKLNHNPANLIKDLSQKLKPALHLIEYAVNNPDKVIEAFKNALGEMIYREVAVKAKEHLSKLGKHFGGVWRHFEVRLEFLKENWWTILKEVGWSFIWPIPNTITDIKKIYGHLKGTWNNCINGKFSTGFEELINAWRESNGLIGRYYGWIILASALIGALVGGPAGAVAGLAVASKIGMGLLYSSIAAEVAMIGKSIVDLNAAKTVSDQENEYGQIADSAISLGIMGALAVLGPIAARFGKAIIVRGQGFLSKLLNKSVKTTEYTLPNGQVTLVARVKNVIVQIDKVLKYPRGKTKPWTEELALERKQLKNFRQNQRKQFDADPKNIERLKTLDDLEHNYKRSVEMAQTLEKAGLPDTPEMNNQIIRHLLEVGKKITAENRVDFPSVLKGSKGEVKCLSTWKITPEGNAYLATIKLIPRSSKALEIKIPPVVINIDNSLEAKEKAQNH